MADAKATFSIDLALSDPSEIAAERAQVQALRTEIEKQTKSLTAQRQALKNLKIGGLENTAQAKALKQRIDETRKSLGANQKSLLSMRGGLRDDAKETKKFGDTAKAGSRSLGSLNQGLKIGNSQLASASTKASGLATALGRAGLAGAAVAGLAAVVALDAAIVKVTIDLAKMAITSSDAYRSERLALEGMTKAWYGWLYQVRAGKAEDVQGAIDEVAQSVTISRSKVNEYAQSLYRANLRGENLKQALKAVAYAASGAGESYAEVAKGIVIQSGMLGQSVGKVAQHIQARFSGVVSKQMLALPTQLAKAREGFAALFRGINIEPVLKGLKNVLGIVDQGTVEFKAWKTIFETLFNPLFAGAEEGGNVIRKFVDKVTILALRAAISWEKMRGSMSIKNLGLDSTAKLLTIVTNGAVGFSVGLLRATQAALVLTDVLVSLGGIAVNVAKMLVNVFSGNWGKDLDKSVEGFGAHLKNLFTGGSDTAKSGFSMIEGIIGGIKLAQPRLNQAVIDAAHESNAAYKNAQGIHSPSTVWAGFGVHQTSGAAIGIERGIPRIRQATMRASEAAVPRDDTMGSAIGFSAGRAEPTMFAGFSPAVARERSGGGQRPVQVTFESITIEAKDSTSSVPVAEFERYLENKIEGLAIQLGVL